MGGSNNLHRRKLQTGLGRKEKILPIAVLLFDGVM
jgi:hypothetical protein